MKGFKLKGAKGIAAGQSRPNGEYSLITTGESEGLTYIFIVLGGAGEVRRDNGDREFSDENAYSDIHKIFSWCLKSFGYTEIYSVNSVVEELPVRLSSEADYVSVVPESAIELLLLKSLDTSGLRKIITYDAEELEAPVIKGQVVGRIEIVLEVNGKAEIVASANLVARNSVERSDMLSLMDQVKNFIFGDVMRVILYILVGLVVIYVIYAFSSFVARTIKKANESKNSKNNRRR